MVEWLRCTCCSLCCGLGDCRDGGGYSVALCIPSLYVCSVMGCFDSAIVAPFIGVSVLLGVQLVVWCFLCCGFCNLCGVLVTMQHNLSLGTFSSHMECTGSYDASGMAVCMHFNIVLFLRCGFFTSLLCSTHFL